MRDLIKAVCKWEKVKPLNIGIYRNYLKFTAGKRGLGKKGDAALLYCLKLITFEIIKLEGYFEK